MNVIDLALQADLGRRLVVMAERRARELARRGRPGDHERAGKLRAAALEYRGKGPAA